VSVCFFATTGRTLCTLRTPLRSINGSWDVDTSVITNTVDLDTFKIRLELILVLLTLNLNNY